MRVQYFNFGSDFGGKSGIVTCAAKKDGDYIKVGFGFTSPLSEFYREKAKKEANKNMNSLNCVIMAGRKPEEKMQDIVRLAWCVAGKDLNIVPKWAKKLDLATKAHLIK